MKGAGTSSSSTPSRDGSGSSGSSNSNSSGGGEAATTAKAQRIDDSTDTNLTVAAGSIVLVRMSERHVAYHHALVLDVTDAKVNIQRTCAPEEESVPTNPSLFKLIPKRYVRSSIRQRLFDKIVARQPDQASILRRELLLDRPSSETPARSTSAATPTSAPAATAPEVRKVATKATPVKEEYVKPPQPKEAGPKRKRMSADKSISQSPHSGNNNDDEQAIADSSQREGRFTSPMRAVKKTKEVRKTRRTPDRASKAKGKGQGTGRKLLSSDESEDGEWSSSSASSASSSSSEVSSSEASSGDEGASVIEDRDGEVEAEEAVVGEGIDMTAEVDVDMEAALKEQQDSSGPISIAVPDAPSAMDVDEATSPKGDEDPSSPLSKGEIDAGDAEGLHGNMAEPTKSDEIAGFEDLALKSLSIYRKNVEKFLEPRVLAKMDAKMSSEVAPNSDPFNLSNIEVLKQPPAIENCTMRDYQLQGLSWLAKHYEMGVNCILADEMGLGKTLQIISLMSHIIHTRQDRGMHLVVTPLSTLFNWMQELKNFCPSLKVSRLHFKQTEVTTALKKQILSESHADVYVTSYEMLKSPSLRFLQRIVWRSVVLDEGHRIKNELSMQSEACLALTSRFKVVLTGTPVQNNLHELFAVLHFLHPKIFTSSVPFDEQAPAEAVTEPASPQMDVDKDNTACNVTRTPPVSRTIDKSLIIDAKNALYPFILRRLKIDVEKKLPPKIETRINCPMSDMQRLWAKRLLLRNAIMMQKIDASVVGATTEEESKRLMNSLASMRGLLMQLRKAADHPFLFPGVESTVLPNGMPTEEIVTVSGKMQMLDRLLPKLKERGHRVVIFSQFTSMLNIIEDYLNWRRYTYYRVDGSSNRVMRGALINLYNKPGSEQFVFLLSTRAGGEGINLYTADTVILFDSDWNPQADAQACGRVHRIGQSKVVHIYRLVTSGSVEERIIQCAQRKLLLGALITAPTNTNTPAEGRSTNASEAASGDGVEGAEDKDPSATLTFSFLKFGWNRLFAAEKTNITEITDDDLNKIIDRNPVESTDVEKESSSETSQLMLENQDVTVDKFDENEPLVPVRLLEGEKIDDAPVDEVLEDLDSRQSRRGKDSSGSSKKGSAMVNIGSKSGGRQIAGRDYQHQDFCQNCWDGGDLIVCDFCPGSYHNTDECIPTGHVDEKKSHLQWACPHHACFLCNKKPDVAGVMFRCEICPCAYCEDCLPVAHEMVGQSLRLELLGYHPKGGVLYVQCSPECIKFAKNEALEFLRELSIANKHASGEISSAIDAGKGGEELVAGDGTSRSKEREAMMEFVGRSAVSAIQHCTLRNLSARLRRSRNAGSNPSPTAPAKFWTLDEIPFFRQRFLELHPRNRAALINILSSVDSDIYRNTSDVTSQSEKVFQFAGAGTGLEDADIAEVFLRTLSVVRPYPAIDLSAIGRALGIGEMTVLFNRGPTREPKFRFIGDAGLRKAMLEELIACFLVTLHPQNMLVGRNTIDDQDGVEGEALDESIHPELYPFCICRWLEALGDHAISHRGHIISRCSYNEALDTSKAIWSWTFSSSRSPPDDETLCKWMAPGFRLYSSFWSQRIVCLISSNLKRLIAGTSGYVPASFTKRVPSIKPASKKIDKEAEAEDANIGEQKDGADEDDAGSVYSANSSSSSSSSSSDEEADVKAASATTNKKRLRPVISAAEVPQKAAASPAKQKDVAQTSSQILNPIRATANPSDPIMPAPLGTVGIQYLSRLPLSSLLPTVRSMFIKLISDLHQNLHIPTHMSTADEKWVLEKATNCGEYVVLMQRASIALGKALAQKLAATRCEGVFLNFNSISPEIRVNVGRLLSASDAESLYSQDLTADGARRELDIHSQYLFNFERYRSAVLQVADQLYGNIFTAFVTSKSTEIANAFLRSVIFGEAIPVEPAPKKQKLKPIHPNPSAVIQTQPASSSSTPVIPSAQVTSEPPFSSSDRPSAAPAPVIDVTNSCDGNSDASAGSKIDAPSESIESSSVVVADSIMEAGTSDSIAATSVVTASASEAAVANSSETSVSTVDTNNVNVLAPVKSEPAVPTPIPAVPAASIALSLPHKNVSDFVNPVQSTTSSVPVPYSGIKVPPLSTMSSRINAVQSSAHTAPARVVIDDMALPVCTAPYPPMPMAAHPPPVALQAPPSPAMTLLQIAMQQRSICAKPGAAIPFSCWNIWDRYLLLAVLKTQYLHPESIVMIISHISRFHVWNAIASFEESEISSILSGALSHMTLPRGPHPEPYIPAVLRDPNSDLQYAPDIPLQLQRWALSLQPVFEECAANWKLLQDCMSRISSDDSVYMRGLFDLIILFNNNGIPVLDMNSALVIRKALLIVQRCMRAYILQLVGQILDALKYIATAPLVSPQTQMAIRSIGPVLAKLKFIQCLHIPFYVDPSAAPSQSSDASAIPLSLDFLM